MATQLEVDSPCELQSKLLQGGVKLYRGLYRLTVIGLMKEVTGSLNCSACRVVDGFQAFRFGIQGLGFRVES